MNDISRILTALMAGLLLTGAGPATDQRSASTTLQALTIENVAPSDGFSVSFGDSNEQSALKYRAIVTGTRDDAPKGPWAIEIDPADVHETVSEKTVFDENEDPSQVDSFQDFVWIPPTLPLGRHDPSTPDDPADDIWVDSLYSIAGVTLTNAGDGYTEAPTWSISGAGGPDLTGSSELAGDEDGNGGTPTGPTSGSIASLDFSRTGCYKEFEPPIVIIDAPPAGGTQATATVTMGWGAGPIDGLRLIEGGSGYTSVPTVGLSNTAGGRGAGTRVEMNEDGSLKLTVLLLDENDEVVSDGSGTGKCYPGPGTEALLGSVLTAELEGGGGSGPAFNAVSVGLVYPTVVGYEITNPGAGYTEPPRVLFRQDPNNQYGGITKLGKNLRGFHARAVATLATARPLTVRSTQGRPLRRDHWAFHTPSSAASASSDGAAVSSLVLPDDLDEHLYTACPAVSISAAPEGGVTATGEVECLAESQGATLGTNYSYYLQLQANYGGGWTPLQEIDAAGEDGYRYDEEFRNPGVDLENAEAVAGSALGNIRVYRLTVGEEHWWTFRNRGGVPAYRIRANGLDFGGEAGSAQAQLYWKPKNEPGQPAQPAVLIPNFTLGKWQLRAEHWDELGDRLSNGQYYVKLTGQTDGYYRFSIELRPDLPWKHPIDKAKILARDNSVWGSVVPPGGGQVESFFDFDRQRFDVDPFFYVTPPGEAVDVLAYVATDRDGDCGIVEAPRLWEKTYDCWTHMGLSMADAAGTEEDDPGTREVLWNDYGYHPAWPDHALIRTTLEPDTAYRLEVWNEGGGRWSRWYDGWPATPYRLHFYEVEEPGDTTATAVSLSLTDEATRVRGGNTSETDEGLLPDFGFGRAGSDHQRLELGYERQRRTAGFQRERAHVNSCRGSPFRCDSGVRRRQSCRRVQSHHEVGAGQLLRQGDGRRRRGLYGRGWRVEPDCRALRLCGRRWRRRRTLRMPVQASRTGTMKARI